MKEVVAKYEYKGEPVVIVEVAGAQKYRYYNMYGVEIDHPAPGGQTIAEYGVDYTAYVRGAWAGSGSTLEGAKQRAERYIDKAAQSV